ncbi:hypothetical protein [Methylococcus sp. EFPC2]|uniref:hypothetical protein n=1 Tax=Methylococcus sp. EFPC2 TaxID=2812648 RepID=UPI0019675236|nr:hypothetical protein [Methylococcus sp. EFPC2]QSA97810.1 hypothetical protein JWZ97_03010 [Methylococcus sp. EFPC2]
MDQIDGWVFQVTSGNPKEGAQGVEMYIVWDASEDAAANLLKEKFSLGDDDILASVEAVTADILSAQGLQPGQASVFQEPD